MFAILLHNTRQKFADSIAANTVIFVREAAKKVIFLLGTKRGGDKDLST